MIATLLLTMLIGLMPTEDRANLNADNKEAAEIQWITLEEAVEKSKKADKLIMIDFYTDWCGWCKRMDATTFTDPAVIAYINKNFYPIKFNAEQKGDVVFQGKTFKFRSSGGRGYHELAFEILNGRLGYPSYAYMTPKYERILISPGYKPAADLQKELKFVAENHYSTTTWDQYSKSN